MSNYPVTQVSNTNLNITSSHVFILAKSDQKTVILTLPTVSGNDGMHVIIKSLDSSNTVTVAAQSGETVGPTDPSFDIQTDECISLVAISSLNKWEFINDVSV